MIKRRPRILIEDDDPDTVELLSDWLQIVWFEAACAKDAIDGARLSDSLAGKRL
jgi:hypothetical protein